MTICKKCRKEIKDLYKLVNGKRCCLRCVVGAKK
jgi:hypothetical protein